jgi:20S proteasome subunit alpha 7
MTCLQAVKHAARIIHIVHDEAKDKSFELEMTWICEDSLMKHVPVPQELIDDAERIAGQELNTNMEQD